MNKLFGFVLCCFTLATAFITAPKNTVIDENDSVAEVLRRLGDQTLPHYPNTETKGVSAEQGKQLVLTGFAVNKEGKKVAKQSAHFVCTSCHNVERDEPNLSQVDPVAKLAYVVEKGLPFVQGSPLYGVVNRTHFYNGDYEKKYGDLVKAARNNLREAIQLCAVECAQGRRLEDWELESILAYLWTIDLKISDLDLTDEEVKQINQGTRDSSKNIELVALLKSKYLQAMPANFATPPEDRQQGFLEIKGNPQNGKKIYDFGCKHCHEGMRYSFFELDDAQNTFKFLDRHISRYTRYSIYQVARYGTSPLPGKGAYMPQYTMEKMNNQQLEDLRTYIQEQAQR